MQAFTAKNDDKAVFLYGANKNLDAGDFDGVQFVGQRVAFFAGDAAGAAIGDFAGGVEGAVVAADGDIVRAEFETDAGGFQRAAADDEFQRIVAEEAEVAGAAAGSDAGFNRDAAAGDAALARASRLGVLAASSSVGPPGSIGRPPRPSETRRTILESFLECSERVSSCMSKSVDIVIAPAVGNGQKCSDH